MFNDLGPDHSNLGEFQYRFIMQEFRFSVPPLLPRFTSSNVISRRLCTVWWRRSLKLPHQVDLENASELQLYVYFWSISYVCVYGLMGLEWCTPAVLFQLYGRLHTDDRPDDDHFCFPFYKRSCTRRLNLLPIFKQGRTSSDLNENSPNT